MRVALEPALNEEELHVEEYPPLPIVDSRRHWELYSWSLNMGSCA